MKSFDRRTDIKGRLNTGAEIYVVWLFALSQAALSPVNERLSSIKESYARIFPDTALQALYSLYTQTRMSFVTVIAFFQGNS